MPPENNITPEVPATPAPADSAAARQKRIEDFLMDPDKAIFRTLEEFRPAVEQIVAILSAVDLDTLEKLEGKDGVTPRRGVEYFNAEDIAALEAFIISKIPKVGVDLASRAQVEAFITAQVAKIPRIKGDDGKSLRYSDLTEEQKNELRGKDGSRDTGVDIVKKIRALRGDKNKMLRIDDVRGLENVLSKLVTDEEFAALEKRVDEFKIVIPANPGGGEGGESGGGDMLAATYDPTNVAGDVFDMDNMVEGADAKILTAAERAKLANVSVTQAVDLDTIESDLAGVKTKADHISVSQAVNLDTMESDIASAKTKTDYLTVTASTDLDSIRARVNDLDAAVVLRGAWDASAGTFPGAGAAQAGSSYIVSVAGTVDGVAFSVNDRVVAIADNASTGTYAANWLKLDYTDQVLSVAGKTGAVTLDAADIAETAGLKVMTAAERTKLSGIETAADVTDADNVGSSIHGASAKTTPVDADTLPIIDSAASNVLKKVTWANIKATLKTYFDTLYAPIAAGRTMQLKIVDDTTALATGDGKLIFMIPAILNGLNLTGVTIFVTTVSSSGAPSVQIRNVTDGVDMLSTNATIDASEFSSLTAATPPVINTSNDDVATGDLIAIDVDGAGTGAKGLGVILTFG